MVRDLEASHEGHVGGTVGSRGAEEGLPGAAPGGPLRPTGMQGGLSRSPHRDFLEL